MAPTKRKRQSEKWTRVKKHAGNSTWTAIRAIVAERKRGNLVEYLVDWDGINTEAGKAWDRSWRPSIDVTAEAIVDWNNIQVARKGSTASTAHHDAPSTASSRRIRIENPIEKSPKRGRGRPHKTRPQPEGQSSSPTAPSSVHSSPHAPSQRTLRSSTRNIPNTSPSRPLSPYVEVDRRNPSSLESYIYISQLDPSHNSPPTTGSITSSPVSHLHAASSFRSTGVVPESEPEDEEDEVEDNPSASYVPTTQTTGGTSHTTSSQPHTSNPSTHESTAISTSLEESPPSPTLSIPETEPEIEATPAEREVVEETVTEHDSEEQLQVEDHWEIPDTFEIGGTLSTVEEPSVHGIRRSTAEELADAPQDLEVPSGKLQDPYQSSHSRVDPLIGNTWTDQRTSLKFTARVNQGNNIGFTDPLTLIDGSVEPRRSHPVAAFEPQAPFFQGQHAQFLSSDLVLSSQQHSSSLDSSLAPVEHLSPVPGLPKQSLGTLNTNTNLPPRLETPTTLSSSAIMNSNEPNEPSTGGDVSQYMAKVKEEAEAKVAAKMKERELEKARKRESLAQSEALERARNLKQQAAPETGTRSPSTIPNRPVVAQVPTSLRTVATAQSEGIPGSQEDIAVDVEAEASSAAPADIDMDEAQYSDDDDDDDESVLNDDLDLQEHAYIVPLPIQGRQADTYRENSKELSELLVPLARHPEEAQQRIEKIFDKLRSIETHIDLVWGGNQTPQPNDDQLVQDKHLVQWSYDNSIKFRFLSALFSRLQTRDLHIILLIENESNTRLYNIVESFLRGTDFSFDCPTTSSVHNATEGKQLKITVLASTSSRVLREAHLIVCLDGKPDTTEIRKKPWGLKPDRSGVPILQLVIPRTIGHIDHYLSSKLNARRRSHTIIATLSQFVNQGIIGHAVDYVPSRSYEIGFADEVVKYLLPSDEPALSEWPLPAIGSIKNIIEYQSQQSIDALNAAPLSGPNAAGKRPMIYIDDRDDPAKKMRFTPQPQTQANTSHVSDSAPGGSLSVEQQRDWWKQEAKRLREVEKAWAKRQWQYEEMRRTYGVLEKEKQGVEKRLADSEQRAVRLREQLNTRTSDNVELRRQIEEQRVELRTRFEEQRDLNLLSEDDKILKIAEKVVEIDVLKEELDRKTKAEQAAIASKKAAESNREYVEARFRDAQSEAASKAQQLNIANEKVAKYERADKAQLLREQHQERQKRLTASKDARLATENKLLQKQLQVKSQELERLKAEMERMKMTRGSLGPLPPSTPYPPSKLRAEWPRKKTVNEKVTRNKGQKANMKACINFREYQARKEEERKAMDPRAAEINFIEQTARFDSDGSDSPWSGPNG